MTEGPAGGRSKAQALDRKVRRGMNLTLMQLIDRKFLEPPFYGVRQMIWHLQSEGHAVNVKRIRRLMRLILICQKPNTSKPAKGCDQIELDTEGRLGRIGH